MCFALPCVVVFFSNMMRKVTASHGTCAPELGVAKLFFVVKLNSAMESKAKMVSVYCPRSCAKNHVQCRRNC